MATLILRDTHRVLEEEIKSLEKEKRDTTMACSLLRACEYFQAFPTNEWEDEDVRP